jgi:DNA-binding NtrC family response regulator
MSPKREKLSDMPLARTAPVDMPRKRLPVQVKECAFVVIDGPDAGKSQSFDSPCVRCGTAPEADIVLTDPAVSRDHFLIRQEPAGFVIEDRSSRNGTLLDGALIREAYLQEGSVIQVGSTRMRFVSKQRELRIEPYSQDEFSGVLGTGPAMKDLFALLNRVAATRLAVVLSGETGTGKELIARAIHQESPRREMPYVVFDCGAVESNLLGPSLFGHVEGAYTGAVRSRKGAFLSAHLGTLFLDEIGELPLDLQPKLLRVLERGEIQPIGSDAAVRVDVRVVCATHRDLAQMVSEGRFREDLFYRLCGVLVKIPRLSERPEDVLPLTSRLLMAVAPGSRIDPQAAKKLAAHSWPGNVRELKNTVERAAMLSVDGIIRDQDVQFHTAAAPRSTADEVLTIEEAERRAIEAALEATAGHKEKAAQLLGISSRTLREKLQRYAKLPR